MQTLKYEVRIEAPSGAVWQVLTHPSQSRQWMQAFSPGAYALGVWEEGAQMRFLDPDRGGTRAVLEVVQAESRVVARHVAVIDPDGAESTSGEMADKWIGTTEDYRLEQADGVTRLSIEIRTHDDFVSMFETSWPPALATIQRLCERGQA